MIWVTIIICGTVILLLGPYAKEKARQLELENDWQEDENLYRQHSETPTWTQSE